MKKKIKEKYEKQKKLVANLKAIDNFPNIGKKNQDHGINYIPNE